MKLLASTESKITKHKNGESVPNLEVVEVILVHCNLVNDNYQQNSRILYAFVPNKAFSSLLAFSPKNHVFLKTFNSEFQEIKIWFTDQTSKPLKVEDKINVTLIIKKCGLSIKMRYLIEPRERRYVKGYGFLSFARNIVTHAAKIAKNMSNKYSQKLVDSAKKICYRCNKDCFKKSNSINSRSNWRFNW